MPVKVWYKSKTIWVNALLLVIAIINVFQANPATNWEFLAISSAVINVVLRFVTVDAIGFFDDDGL
jgi:amino acid permease